MNTLSSIEGRRLLLQSQLDAGKTSRERNRLGQFATPSLLASDVLSHAKMLLPPDVPVRFFDPAIGTGAFYAALLREFPTERIQAAAGVEIDPHYGTPTRKLWDGHPLDLILGDFTTMKSPNESERFNLIICNPPYVRHHHISTAEKSRLQAVAASIAGVRITGLAGLYCYFLGLSHAWLADDGIAGWLIPSEFMDVNYGSSIKNYLLNQVELLRIHRFDPNDLQFGDALVSSAIVWFRKRRPTADHVVELSYGGTLTNPAVSRHLRAQALHNVSKWTPLAANGVRTVNDGPKLANFFSIKRGLATGDNRFFIMSQTEIAERGLPREFFKPILPGPRFLLSDIIQGDSDGVPMIERQQFLLDCRLPEDEIRIRYPALAAYLETGKQTVAETYLCSRRTPWYAQEIRPAAPFICTYMGRNLAKRQKPFRFILNRSRATAANVYLLLYPKPAMARALESNADLAHKVWEFLNEIPTEKLLGEGRVYGGGLYKMEPKELANVPADTLSALIPSPNVCSDAQGEMFRDEAA